MSQIHVRQSVSGCSQLIQIERQNKEPSSTTWAQAAQMNDTKLVVSCKKSAGKPTQQEERWEDSGRLLSFIQSSITSTTWPLKGSQGCWSWNQLIDKK